MVSIKSLLALLAVQAMTAAAAPAPVSDDPAMELMAQASVYFCSDIRWNGECRNHLIDLDKCRKPRSPAMPPPRPMTLLRGQSCQRKRRRTQVS